MKETSAKKMKRNLLFSLHFIQFSLTENRDEGKEASNESGGDKDEDKRVQLVILCLLADLLIQGVGGHGVVVVVEVPGRHRRSVLVLKRRRSFFNKYIDI